MTNMTVDPRGPFRTIISALETPVGKNVYVLDCGHTAVHAAHFMLDKPGEQCRCYYCGVEARNLVAGS